MILGALLLVLQSANCVSAQGGTPRVSDVTIPSQSGGTLAARVYAPDAALQTAPCPCVTMLPGGGAPISSVEWAAQSLAQSGYVVIVTQPSSGGSTAAYSTAASSGVDFLASAANPYASSTDITRVGAAGWSLGARSLSRTQEEDARIDAIVAWDNLARSENGDEGSPACSFVPGTVRTPRVPAMGQASDTCTTTPDAKKTAFTHWRSAGVQTMEVVFAGATHFWWGAQGSTGQHDLSIYYTLAWFDRWLKNLPTARDRLVARNVLGQDVSVSLSSLYRSAAWFDGIDCPDLRAGCPLIGTTFCVSDPNSTGAPARIAATGSASVSANDLTLSAWRVPANQSSIFYTGTSAIEVPFGNGWRCVAGVILRLPIVNSGPLGELVFNVDLTLSPLVGNVLPGTTWYFQGYFRDAIAGGSNFDLSDGIAITFVP